MPPSSPTTSLDHRPLKRPRNHPPEEVISAPVDHIFIADGVSAKKAGAKKTPLSCCECRRLKLKCDRSFPCASCRKRGCAEICPDGVLVSGKGTRFILANTEQLHLKIHEMSERIRVLEESLGSMHRIHEGCLRNSSHNFQSSTTLNILEDDDDDDKIPLHPLLVPNLLAIKSTMGLYTGAGGNATNSAKEENDRSMDRDDGDSAKQSSGRQVDRSSDPERGSSEDTIMVSDAAVGELATFEKDGNRIGLDQLHDLRDHVVRLSHAFPLSSTVWVPPQSTTPVGGDSTCRSAKEPPSNLALREYIRSQLPPREEAEYLWEQARRNALWQYNPHPSPIFFPNLAHHVYSSAVSELCSRRLALFFMILAVGCNVDLDERERKTRNSHSPKASFGQDSDMDNPLAETYHQLARASLCEIPIMEETNVDVILALFWEVWYLLVFSDRKKAAAYAWGIMGLTAKLAQSIGLHRNGGKSKVIPEEVEKRRALFWELLYLDARLSLSLGRPPSLSINHVDCQRPSYMPDDDSDLKHSLHHYQEWKHSCYINCLSPVLDAISQPTINLDYTLVLDLDRRIRDFPIPVHLRKGNGDDSRSLVMQKGSLCTALEAVLLQLHRTFFTCALSGFDEAFNRRHKYAPSVVAVFLGASRMIATVQDLYRREPLLTSRILGYWSNAFSSAVALCLLVSRAPFTCLSPAALQELERARILFRLAQETCPRALQVLPILETMVDKTNDIYNRWCHGQEVSTLVLRHTTDDVNQTATNGEVAFTGYQQSRESYQDSTQHHFQPYEQQRNSYRQHDRGYQQLQQQQTQQAQQQQHQQQQPDPFIHGHSSLAQCIVEVHERARMLFPLRKPCMCSAAVAKSCPPSHSWSPPPKIPQHQQNTPVLPPEAPLVVPGTVYGNGGLNSAYSTPSPYHRGRTLQGGYESNHGYGGGNGHSSLGEGLYSSTVLPSDGATIPIPPPMSTLSPTSKMAVVDTLNFDSGALNVNTEHNWMAFF